MLDPPDSGAGPSGDGYMMSAALSEKQSNAPATSGSAVKTTVSPLLNGAESGVAVSCSALPEIRIDVDAIVFLVLYSFLLPS
jgi:hypothetical protein